MSTKHKNINNIIVKESIVQSLLKIINEKPLSSVNISELCHRAHVSRMAFYRNYNSIEDIFIKELADIFTEYSKDNTDSVPNHFCDISNINHYFDYVYRHRDFLDGLLRCGFDVIFLDMLNKYILDKWNGKSDKCTLIAFSGSLYNMFRLWSSSGYSENREKYIQVLMNLYYPDN